MENKEIKVFSPTEAELNKLVKESNGLEIKGIDDEVGYNLVHKARINLKSARVMIKKCGKEAREEAIKFQRDIISKENELIAMIEPTEKNLEEKQRAIDDEKKRLKRLELLPEKKEKLKEINITIDDNFILGLDEDSFNSFFNDKKLEYLEEKERLAEEKRLKEEMILKEKKDKLDEDRLKLEEDKRLERAKKKAVKEAKENAVKDAIAAKVKAEEDKKNAIEDAKQKLIQEQKEKDDARIAEEEKLVKESQDKLDKEKADKEKMEKEKKYQKFLSENGYNDDTKDKFLIVPKNNIVILYKKVAEYIIKS